ncbi:MAG: hypothetical protein M1822_004762 [Bathelium mastoideum]|nr:MAG: hypothetical protein M1822_004762 [Bathelium mastoideum]
MAGLSFIANLGARFFQILFAIIVLGISSTMAKWQTFGSAPATTVYGAFTGGFALLIGLVGAVSIFLEVIPAIIVAGADALAAVLTLAAGIAYAVTMRGVHCSDVGTTYNNVLLDGGSIKAKGGPLFGYDSPVETIGRCRKAEADYAFMFLTFAVSAILVGLGLLTSGRRGGNKGVV